MAQFALDLSKFAGLTEKKLETVVKKTFIGLSADIIRDTPVDTGRARANWQPSINDFNKSVSDDEDKQGNDTILKVSKKANEFKIGQTLTLANNLPYIQRLEYGYSKKNPNGMLRVNILRWQTHLDNEARKLK